MGWLIAFGILVLLAITPVGVYAAYNSEGILLRIIAGPARITILRPKEKKPKKETKGYSAERVIAQWKREKRQREKERERERERKRVSFFLGSHNFF